MSNSTLEEIGNFENAIKELKNDPHFKSLSIKKQEILLTSYKAEIEILKESLKEEN